MKERKTENTMARLKTNKRDGQKTLVNIHSIISAYKRMP